MKGEHKEIVRSNKSTLNRIWENLYLFKAETAEFEKMATKNSYGNRIKMHLQNQHTIHTYS